MTMTSLGRPQASSPCNQPTAKTSWFQDFAIGLNIQGQDPVTNFLGAVPGAMLGNKQAVCVFSREHIACIESQAQSGTMRIKLGNRRRVVRTVSALAKLFIQKIALVAIRETKVHTGLWCVIQLIGRQIVTEHDPGHYR